LIGKHLVRKLESGEVLSGRIVETEAYVGVKDRASHAFGGRRTARNESMYGPPGTAYVYFTYGMHFCMNVVCGERDEPIAVLLRALEPVMGIETMRRLRGAPKGRSPAKTREMDVHDLCSGPARLCQALAIDRSLDGVDLTRDERLWIARPGKSDNRDTVIDERLIRRSTRVGVGYAGEWARRPLRWLVEGHPSVSVKHRPRLARRR
jgi:DNA-3-methyladenine glycosylase